MGEIRIQIRILGEYIVPVCVWKQFGQHAYFYTNLRLYRTLEDVRIYARRLLPLPGVVQPLVRHERVVLRLWTYNEESFIFYNEDHLGEIETLELLSITTAIEVERDVDPPHSQPAAAAVVRPHPQAAAAAVDLPHPHDPPMRLVKANLVYDDGVGDDAVGVRQIHTNVSPPFTSLEGVREFMRPLFYGGQEEGDIYLQFLLRDGQYFEYNNGDELEPVEVVEMFNQTVLYNVSRQPLPPAAAAGPADPPPPPGLLPQLPPPPGLLPQLPPPPGLLPQPPPPPGLLPQPPPPPDIIPRQQAAQRGCLLVRQSFFHDEVKSSVDDVGGGVTACRGFHSSFRTIQSGLSLNMDVSSTMILTPGRLLELLINQNVRDPRQIDWLRAKKMLKNLRIKTRKPTNERKPTQMIIFRDGVGESQFNQVLNIELEQIIKALKHLGETDLPKFTVIVAQKNHHTKLFQAGGRPENVPPGTVVDTKVVHPRNYDFYMCTQAGMIGTSRPAHYHVLLDEIGFTADDLQKLVHSLSYVYQRSTTAISMVAPICYSHHAASQVGQFIKFDDFSETSSGDRAITSAGPVPGSSMCFC